MRNDRAAARGWNHAETNTEVRSSWGISAIDTFGSSVSVVRGPDAVGVSISLSSLAFESL